MFLYNTDEQELLIVLNNYKGKSSKGYGEIDMYFLKKVIYHTAKRLTYICNTLFKHLFLDDMKVSGYSCL